MKKHKLRLAKVCLLTILVVEIALLNFRWRGVPALAPLLHPTMGAWALPDDDLTNLRKLRIQDLKGSVRIEFDHDKIPHITAENDDDLYAAEGFVVASERLWQMEFVSRLADGRLSEIIGAKTVPVDTLFARLGLHEAAESSLALMKQDLATDVALRNFARGANSYIDSLNNSTLPFEFKLLGITPERWTPLKSALVMKFMSFSMSLFGYDIRLNRSADRILPEELASLFPLEAPVEAPMVPEGTLWAFHPKLPVAPQNIFRAKSSIVGPYPAPNPANGSNNWVISGAKSETGYPIVANDVHLGYQVPALWYELQLRSGQQNAYGVSLPGLPGLLLGFNDKTAWAVTNGVSDVADWFALTYDSSGTKYKYGDEWRPIVTKVHEIKVRDGASVQLQIRKTHFGPILYEEAEAPLDRTTGRGLALKWEGLEPSNETKAFIDLNHARNFDQCRQAISILKTPPINIVCADMTDIGETHQGHFPVRWPGQGRMISDGADPRYDWNSGYVPEAELPQSQNPARGFLFSSNQVPADSTYPYYINGPFEVPYRPRRVKELLMSKEKFSIADMRAFQADSLLIHARETLPLLLTLIPQTADPVETAALAKLRTWDFRFLPTSSAATIYDVWFTKFRSLVWSDKFPAEEESWVPNWDVTARLLRDTPNSKWFDRRETPEVETAATLARLSFSAAIGELQKRFGPRVETWTWGLVQPAHFDHLSKIPGLGAGTRETIGHPYTVFSNRSEHGPVWSSVVALGPKPRAWAIYPGGQSGHPMSRFYETFLDQWSKNEMHEIDFLNAESPTLKNSMASIQFLSNRGTQE